MKIAKKGFTLIELLVVVAIIAVLIAILLPSLGRAKEKAKTVKCMTVERTFYQGMSMYQADFDGFIAPCGINAPNKYAGFWFGPQILGYELGKTTAAVQITIQKGSEGNSNAFNDAFEKAFRCPSTDPTPYDAFGPSPPQDPNYTNVDHGSYTYNMNLGFATGTSPKVYSNVKASAVPRTTLALLEAHGGLDKGEYDYRFSCLANNAAGSGNSGTTADLLNAPSPASIANGDSGYGPTSTPLAGHPHQYTTMANMLFVDGSIVTGDPQKMNSSGTYAEWIVQAALWNKPTSAFPYTK